MIRQIKTFFLIALLVSLVILNAPQVTSAWSSTDEMVAQGLNLFTTPVKG
jgi:hypothetical protein